MESCRKLAMISEACIRKKQNDILEAAKELFLEHGYEAVSVDAIVERVGGSKTTVYNYFGGKEGLFVATLQRFAQELLGPLLALDVSALGPEAGLGAIGTEFLKMLVNPKGRSLFLTIIGESRRFPELGACFFENGPGTCIRAISRNIRRWQEDGSIRSGDPDVLAEQYLGGILGTLNSAVLLGLPVALTPSEIEKRVASRTEVFLEGARCRHRPSVS